jgi:hypothetical protein
VAAEVVRRVVVEQHLLPHVTDQGGHRAGDGEPVGRVRVRGIEDPMAGLLARHLDERRDVRRRCRMVRTSAAGGQRQHGPPIEGALDAVPLARHPRALAVDLRRPQDGDRQPAVEQHVLGGDLVRAVPLPGVVVHGAGSHGGLLLGDRSGEPG